MIRQLPISVALLLLLLFITGNNGIAQTADFSASPISGCSPLLVNFTDNSTGAITSYSWNLGNSVTSTLQNPSTTYTSPGTYPVTLTVTSTGGTTSKTISIIVYDQPVVAFSAAAPLTGCTPHYVQFSSTVTPNAPGTVTYNWDFGDGTTGTGPSPDHTYNTPGVYTVLLTATNGAGCATTIARSAYISAYPVARGGFSVSQNYFCSTPATAVFSNTSTGGTIPYTTNWDFGDGGTGLGNSVSHTYTSTGNFTVTMIVSDAHGCADTVAVPSYMTVVGTTPSFSAPASVCEEATVIFGNTTSGSNSTSWDFGDGIGAVGNTTSHEYATAGTYTVTMTTNISGCVKTVAKSILVNPKPAAIIGQQPSIPCPAPVTVAFSGSSTHAVSYSWSWNSGGVANGQSVSKHYTKNIRDTLFLYTTSAAGCLDTAMIDTILIRGINTGILIGPGDDAYAGCPPHTVNFTTELWSSIPKYPPGPERYPVPENSWLWDFGDGTSSAGYGPVHTYNDTGDFQVRCIVTTYNGCKDTGYSTVHVDSPTRPTLIASPLAICQGEWVEFINTTPNPLPRTLYSWTFVDEHVLPVLVDTAYETSGTARMWNGFEKPGSYSVLLQTNHRGCRDGILLKDYIIVHPPGATFMDSIFCPPSTTVKFINTSVVPTSQLWFFGDGDTSTAFSPTHTYASRGAYTVTLVVHNSTYGCSDTVSKNIFVIAPSLGFAADDSAICKDDFGRLRAGFIGASPKSYSWRFENVHSPFDSSNLIDYQFLTRGRYDVTVYVRSGQGCVDSMTKPGYMLVAHPEVNFGTYPPIGCKPLPVLFVDSTTNTAGVKSIKNIWVFGDGDSSTNILPSINKTYAVNGSYTVRLIVTDSLLCSDSLIRNDHVSVHKPTALFSNSADSVCYYQLIDFTASSTGTVPMRHYWDFGDGKTDTGNKVSHGYVNPGIYTVRLIATDTVGCSDTLSRINLIKVSAPHAAFSVSDTLAICPPMMVRFANQSTAASTYLWDFGNGSAKSPVTNPLSTYNNPGVFNIIMVATDQYGCTDTATAQVRVLGYSGAFSYTPVTGCAPMTLTFTTPLTGIPQITWDFADGTTQITSGTSTTHTYLNAGPYLPKVIFSDGAGCSSPSFGLDTIRVDQVIAAFGWSVPCAGTPFTLTDSSTALYTAPGQRAWYFGGGDTAAGSPVSYTFAAPGNYPVTMVAGNATGCRDTIVKDVFINPLPEIRASDDTGICPNDRISLLATGGASYTWSPAPDSMNNCPVCDLAFVHLDSAAGGTFKIYTVTGTDSKGCVNKDSVRVSIQLRTEYSTGAGGEICVGESFRLHAEGAQKYEWLPAATLDSPFIASPLASPQQTTTYIVAAREGSCDIDSQSVTVVVHSLPLFSAGNDEIIALGSAVTLKPTRIGISRIEWSADTTLTCLDCFDPAAHPHYTRTYYATGYNEFGCRATDSVTVHVRCNGSLVFIPNTFTPNGDGLNDYFFPRGDGIERMSVFRIYNRWGELVFERSNAVLNDERGGWDGSYKGNSLPPDVYMYMMQSTCSSGDIIEWKGDVTIMR